jgi:hypothetical protein
MPVDEADHPYTRRPGLSLKTMIHFERVKLAQTLKITVQTSVYRRAQGEWLPGISPGAVRPLCDPHHEAVKGVAREPPCRYRITRRSLLDGGQGR